MKYMEINIFGGSFGCFVKIYHILKTIFLTSKILAPAAEPLTTDPNSNEICANDRCMVCEAIKNAMTSPAVNWLVDKRYPPI